MRQLSKFEKATVLSSNSIPVNVVTALVLDIAPEPAIMKQALQSLQNRHPLLKAKIDKRAKHYYFSPTNFSGFEFNLVLEFKEKDWIITIENELMRSFNLSSGPLFSIHYFYSAIKEGESSLVASFHHSIMDATGAINLLGELLITCAALEANVPLPTKITTRLLIPDPPEQHYPEAIHGKNIRRPLFRFVGRQAIDEIRYQWQTRRKPKHAVMSQSVNKIIPLQFSKEHTTQLVQFARQHELTLNSLINATMLNVIWQKFLDGASIPLRAFTFADLRSYLNPPASAEHTAPHVSMMRYMIDAKPGEGILDLAIKLNQKINQSFKRYEKFLFNFVSDKVMQAALSMKNMRMASTALSYSGVIPLKETYGSIKVKALHGYISTPPFGPVLAAEAGILYGKLFVDFVYQDLDMSHEIALICVQEIEKQLIGKSVV